MQTVSSKYNPYPPERWSNIRVIFDLVDVDAAENATVAATSQASISKIDQTHNRITTAGNKIASLEQNYFLLDGSFILPNQSENGEVGWWSQEISDSIKTLINPQILEFNFTADQSSVGFTVIFDDKANQYAEDFKIQVYNSAGTLMGEDIVTNNTKYKYVSDMPIDGYRRVKITFTKTSFPYRRVRVTEIVFGIIQTFDNCNTTEMKLLYEISPRSENLPSNELTLTIENVNKKYNMINPKGIYKYLQEGQALSVALGVGDSKETIEYINMGRFYYTTSTAEDNSLTAQIVAHDKIYDLDRDVYRKGLNTTDTVLNIVNDIIADSGIQIPINIPQLIASRVIGRNIPVISHREALRMVAQAARAVCFINRNGILVFAELVEASSVDTLNNNNMTSPVKVSVSELVNVIEVTSFDFRAGSSNEIYKAVVSINGSRTLWVQYSGAASSVTASITGGTINKAEYYLYAAKFTITASADVTLVLTGNSLDQVQSTYRTGTENPELLKRIENPLVKSSFSADFGQWILGVLKKRVTYNAEERGNPAREVGDTIKIYDAYNENRNAIVTKEEYNFNGVLKAITQEWGMI